MKVHKQIIKISILSIILSVTACTQQQEEIIKYTDMIVAEKTIDKTEGEDKPHDLVSELNAGNAWHGYYSHYGKSPDGGSIRMDLFIYPDGEKNLGYLSMDGSGSNGEISVYSDLQGRMLLEVLGNEDMIDVYFVRNITERVEGHEITDSFQKGDLMFSLIKKEGEIVTVWQDSLLDEQNDDLKNGFMPHDEMRSIILVDEKDYAQYLKVNNISEDERPFYQYYNEDGELILELYYNEPQTSGIGIFYEQYQGQLIMNGFETGNLNISEWEEHEFYVKTGREDDLQLEDYEEEITYNERGQETSFCSYGVVTGYKEPIREWVVKIASTYREDGTIQKQKCSYNGRALGRRSGTFYYDQQERLEYIDAYITHGYVEYFYIYDGDNRKPRYCLVLDHMGRDVWALNFIRYELD